MSHVYQKGKIYRIRVDWSNRQFIGSTCTTLSKCRYNHGYKAKKEINEKNILYHEMREHNFEGWQIELIEKWPCTNKKELASRRDYHIREAKIKGIGLYNCYFEARDKENKYSNGKIYKIVVSWSDKQYIGSTIRLLTTRKSAHQTDAKFRPQQTKFHTELSKHLDEEWKIELIELWPCKNKKELLAREGYYIRKYLEEGIPLFNIVLEHGDNKEYIAEKEARFKERRKRRDRENKEKIDAQRKEYTKANSEIIKKRRKEYNDKNKEKILQQRKEKQEDKYICECGMSVPKHRKTRHEKSQTHILYSTGVRCYTCICGSTFGISRKGSHEQSKKHKKFVEEQSKLYHIFTSEK